MRKAVLFTIIEPKIKGESPKMYWVEDNMFSTIRDKAHVFESKEEVESVQNKFPFDMQLEYLEA